MLRTHTLCLAVAIGLAVPPCGASAQQKTLKEQIIGTWTIVSNDNFAADGTRQQPFGADPKGVTIYDAQGRYIQIMLRSNVSKFKVNNRMRGTDEENRAVVHGSAASFGTWSLDEANRILVVSLDGSIFPNLQGTVSKRSITLSGDELRISNPTAGSGGRAEQVWRRARSLPGKH